MRTSSVVPEPVSASPPALARPRLMRQDWRDLTYLHWAVEPERVAPFMPAGVRPDVHDGATYVGLIPFRMVDAGFAHGPGVPYAGSFLETNVRLYSVDGTGRRGIVFLSLDTDRSLVVAGARAAFGLPYRWARMRHNSSCAGGGTEHRYDARLRWPRGGPRSRIVVRAHEPVLPAPLDVFLSARWGLHLRHLRHTWYVPNAHAQWTFRRAELRELDDELVASVGLPGVSTRPPDHVGFSDGVHTEFGPPVLASSPRPGTPHGPPVTGVVGPTTSQTQAPATTTPKLIGHPRP
ncbi:MAG: YqjF family protein [Nocardioidaceae bacterium]